MGKRAVVHQNTYHAYVSATPLQRLIELDQWTYATGRALHLVKDRSVNYGCIFVLNEDDKPHTLALSLVSDKATIHICDYTVGPRAGFYDQVAGELCGWVTRSENCLMTSSWPNYFSVRLKDQPADGARVLVFAIGHSGPPVG